MTDDDMTGDSWDEEEEELKTPQMVGTGIARSLYRDPTLAEAIGLARIYSSCPISQNYHNPTRPTQLLVLFSDVNRSYMVLAFFRSHKVT